MTAPAARTFVDGAPLSSAETLQAWLDGVGDRIVKLPILVDYDGISFSNARVALVALPLTLDDSSLGVGLADRVRVADNGGQGWAPIVGVWLEGRWKAGQLRVDRADRAGLPVELATATHALIEASP